MSNDEAMRCPTCHGRGTVPLLWMVMYRRDSGPVFQCAPNVGYVNYNEAVTRADEMRSSGDYSMVWVAPVGACTQ